MTCSNSRNCALARFVGERLRPSMIPTWYQPFWHPDAQRATHQDAFEMAGKDLRDLSIQARKAYLKEVLRTLFSG